MNQQHEILEQSRRDHEIRAALEKVYGPAEPGAATMPSPQSIPSTMFIRQLLKDEKALLKTQLRLATLKSKLHL